MKWYKEDIIELKHGFVQLNVVGKQACVHITLNGPYTISDHRLLKQLMREGYVKGMELFARPFPDTPKSIFRLLKMLKFRQIHGREWYKKC